MENVKTQAKALRAYLAEQGVEISHSQALEATARSHGFKDWNTMSAATPRVPVLETLPRFGDEDCETNMAPLTEVQEAQMQREASNRKWLKDHPGLHEVTLVLTHNEHGTPTLHTSGKGLTPLQITQPPDVYVAAIRMAYSDHEWSKNPRDDLGDLPTCESGSTTGSNVSPPEP